MTQKIQKPENRTSTGTGSESKINEASAIEIEEMISTLNDENNLPINRNRLLQKTTCTERRIESKQILF